MPEITQYSTLPDPVARLADIKHQILSAATEAALDGASVTITAVSKKHTAATIEKALEGGHRVFGENRVQEAQGKWPALKSRFPDVELHLIGPLQSNKAGDAVALFDVIETVDREKIARVLSEEMTRQDRALTLFVQVNTGEEPQKAGIAPGQADAFIDQCKTQYGLTIAGLMCIPPADEPPAPHFALLKKIADRNGLAHLSMGMSGDFDIAVQLGATHVRIGEQIFGPRPR